MSDTLLGVIIGGLFTFLGGVFGVFLQHRWETTRFQRDQKKEAYEAASMYLINFAFNHKLIGTEPYNQIANTVTVKMSLYASPNVYKYYEDMYTALLETDLTNAQGIQILNKMSGVLNAMMRADLEIDAKPRRRIFGAT